MRTQIRQLKREDVRDVHLNIEFFFETQKKLEQQIVDQIRDRNIILVLGNSGDGKSTLVASLVFGPDSLGKVKLGELGETNKRRARTEVIDFNQHQRGQM